MLDLINPKMLGIQALTAEEISLVTGGLKMVDDEPPEAPASLTAAMGSMAAANAHPLQVAQVIQLIPVIVTAIVQNGVSSAATGGFVNQLDVLKNELLHLADVAGDQAGLWYDLAQQQWNDTYGEMNNWYEGNFRPYRH